MLALNKYVYLKNDLVRAAHGLSLMEKRLLMLAISRIDSKQPATIENMTVRVNVSEFSKAFGVTAKSTYNDVKLATEQLMDRYIRFSSPDGKQEVRMQWVGRATYVKDMGTVEIAFWHELSPMLFELEKHFTGYKLSRAGGLKSVYSWRIFELIMQFKNTGILKIEIPEFMEIMEAPESYKKDFGLHRVRVIEPAIKEIREKDGLRITWKPIKTSRKVTALEFKFPVEPQHELFKIDKPFIDKHARPGESYEQAEKRLKEEAKNKK